MGASWLTKQEARKKRNKPPEIETLGDLKRKALSIAARTAGYAFVVFEMPGPDMDSIQRQTFNGFRSF